MGYVDDVGDADEVDNMGNVEVECGGKDIA